MPAINKTVTGIILPLTIERTFAKIADTEHKFEI